MLNACSEAACKDIRNSTQRKRWEELPDNTNGQEGLGGFLQALSGRNKLELDEVCLLCVQFVKKFSRKYAAGKDLATVAEKKELVDKYFQIWIGHLSSVCSRGQ